MNSYLLDTHIFLWAYMKPEKIGKSISRILENPNAVRYLSAISLIEIVRLYETKPKDFDLNIPLSTFLSQVLTQLQVQTLAITPEHAQRYYEIQPIDDHKDPFDYLPPTFKTPYSEIYQGWLCGSRPDRLAADTRRVRPR